MNWVNRDKNWYTKKKSFVQVVWHKFYVYMALSGSYLSCLHVNVIVMYWWIAVYLETDISLHPIIYAL